MFVQVQVGVIPRKYENVPRTIHVNDTVGKLSVLVENQGRINYGSFMEDRKVSRGTFFVHCLEYTIYIYKFVGENSFRTRV